MEVNIKMYEKNTLMERILEILKRLDTRELRLVYFFAEGLKKGADCHGLRPRNDKDN